MLGMHVDESEGTRSLATGIVVVVIVLKRLSEHELMCAVSMFVWLWSVGCICMV